MPWLTAQIALDSRMQDFRPTLETAYHGTRYDAPANTIHARVANIPAGSDMATLGESGQARTRGIYQVTVFSPSGKGTGAALSKAAAIADHFMRQRLTEADVDVQCEVPSQGPVIPEADWLQVPVSIPYFIYT
jgi:hypothetical protein